MSLAARRGAHLCLLVVGVLLLTAQYGRRREVLCGEVTPPNTHYSGKFTFVRVRFDPSPEAGYRDLKWDHDCPRAEQNFAKILKELTYIEPYEDGGNIFDLDDDELFRYPIAYVSEPGFWIMSDKQVSAFRAYLLKGGFAIFDDFQGWHWQNFEFQMRRVLPDARLVELDVTHPVFDSFFRMKTLEFARPYDGTIPMYYGIYEDNDPAKRLMLVANYNNDIGEFWEWSDEGYVPIELSNEAYKLGVNYVMYGMTH
jgi:hypothetical protein